MRFSALWLTIGFPLLFLGCGERAITEEEYGTRLVKLPDGKEIRAEVMLNPADMQRGMMFRGSLPRGKGMLFIHRAPGTYGYWMYQVKIPLDIIWMDSNRRVVEISADTPPCQKKPAECPSYGGKQSSQFVLELAGGEAQRLGLKPGDTLTF